VLWDATVDFLTLVGMYVVVFVVALAVGGVLALAFWIEQRVWQLWRERREREDDDAP
jgi:hypothetical protein